MKFLKPLLLGLFLFGGLNAQELAPDYTFNIYMNQSIDFRLYEEVKKNDPDFDVVIFPENGYITNNEGTITYSPTVGWSGTDTFVYELSTGKGKKAFVDEGTITINVSGEPIPADTVYITQVITQIDSIIVTEYTTILDTIFVQGPTIVDTTYITVTNTVIDTVFSTITEYVPEYVNVYLIDTVYVTDTVVDTIWLTQLITETVFDTIIVIDTVIETRLDTVIVTVSVPDTIILIDTLLVDNFIETILIDTFVVYVDKIDTLYLENIIIDTLVFTDTLFVPADTFIVSITDTLFFPPDTIYIQPDTLFIYVSDTVFVDIANSDTSLLAIGIHGDMLPEAFALHPNYPNPFNPVTTINFEMPRADRIDIIVYDVRGREVKKLVSDYLQAGFHRMTWNSTNSYGAPMASGVYFIRMVSPTFTHTLKITLLK